MADLRSVVGETPVERVLLVQVINDAGETADFLATAADDSDLMLRPEQVVEVATRACGALSAEERAAVLGDTARSVYGLA